MRQSRISYLSFSSDYLNGHGRSDIPKEIITSNSFEGADALTKALEHLINRSVKIKHSVRGARAKWMELAAERLTLISKQAVEHSNG
ncbi:MAG: hypothetical protein CM15mP51_21050 [Porticoccaceae bacterium]|nr:MAG: hypothetical protein CM15mP51_21050 [Porticoccaceae bacterium]